MWHQLDRSPFRFSTMKIHRFVLIVLAAVIASPGMAHAQPFPQINIQGDTYASACGSFVPIGSRAL
jgi:hypothetical protein